ncbi:MAG: hypothetical protein AAF441_15650 [Pseudomonadota bacterium]
MPVRGSITSKAVTAARLLAFCLLALTLLAGCAGNISDDISLDEVAGNEEGIVIVYLEMPSGFYTCPGVSISLKRLDGGGEKVYYGRTVKNSALVHAPSQFRIDAGKYAFINANCRDGYRKISLLRKPGRFGTFEVRAGEVVNIGKLTWGGPNVIASTLQAGPMPEEQLKWLAKHKPKLSARMQTRLFEANTRSLLTLKP